MKSWQSETLGRKEVVWKLGLPPRELLGRNWYLIQQCVYLASGDRKKEGDGSPWVAVNQGVE